MSIAYRWRVVALLWGISVLNFLDRQIIYSLLPLLRTDLHMSDFALGLTGSAFLWTYGLLSPVSGYAADRFGRARVISLSLLVWTVVTWATGHARNSTELLSLRALMGISESCYVPAALALIADLHGERTRSLATGIHQNGLYVGVVLGGIGGGWLGDHYGWRPAFSILGGAGLLYWILQAVLLRNRGRAVQAVEPIKLLPATRELFSLPRFRVLMALFGLYSIIPWTFYTWMPLHLYERFGLSLTNAGLYATLWTQAASIAGTFAGGALADHFGVRSPRGRVLVQAAGLLLAGPGLLLATAAPAKGMLAVGLLCFGFGRSFYETNVMPSLCQVVRPELRSTAMGFCNFAGCLSGGMMTAIAGGVKQTLGLTAVFQAIAVLLVVIAIVLARVRMAAKSVDSKAILLYH